MPELGGWLWFTITVLGVALLGVALAYGTVQWRKRPRDPMTEHARDEATRRNFDKR